jgi:hypothetical protein
MLGPIFHGNALQRSQFIKSNGTTMTRVINVTFGPLVFNDWSFTKGLYENFDHIPIDV